MPKLTKRLIDGLESNPDRPMTVWDDKLAGFGIKLLPSGAKKFVVKYRVGVGGRSATQRWMTLGAYGNLTCEQARQQAQQILSAVTQGEDPQADKIKRRTQPRLNDVWSEFSREILPLRKKKTRHDYGREWTGIIAPALGKRFVVEITRQDATRLHQSLKHVPYRANRVIALLSRLMTLAEAWEWRDQGTNPCRFVQRYKETPRQRYLSKEELFHLGSAMTDLVDEASISQNAANAITLLVLTGARLNELLTAKWIWVDWGQRQIFLPDSKTGQKSIFLSKTAVMVLRNQEAQSGDHSHIFPGGKPDAPLVNLRKNWVKICDRSGLEAVRIHDLRHTAASIAVGQGVSLPVIGRLLGHTQAQTTMRYAHVDVSPALLAADKIGEAIEDAFMTGRSTIFASCQKTQ